MNTIGKKGKLGEHIRCVVSVAMLTEGWDANTVTHILGVRPFRSQLLCEQVVGRGLRRRNYAVNPGTGRFEPEYAEVYGVPFAFIPGDRQIPKPREPRPAVEVRALPRTLGPGHPLPQAGRLPRRAARRDPPRRLRRRLPHAPRPGHRGPVGQEPGGHRRSRPRSTSTTSATLAPQRIAFAIAKTLIEREEFFAALGGAQRPWLFPQLVDICRHWLDECVTTEPGVTKGHLLLAQAGARAAEKVFGSIVRYPESRQPVLMPVIRRFDSSGSTDDVHFITRKVVMDPPPDQVPPQPCRARRPARQLLGGGARPGPRERPACQVLCEERAARVHDPVCPRRAHPRVRARLPRPPGHRPDDVERTLIIEVSGSRKSPGPTAAKADTARNQWCAAVNNWGEFGRWGYVEVHNPLRRRTSLSDAIDNLYADRPIIGLPA